MTKQMPERVYVNVDDYSINIQGFKQGDETREWVKKPFDLKVRTQFTFDAKEWKRLKLKGRRNKT